MSNDIGSGSSPSVASFEQKIKTLIGGWEEYKPVSQQDLDVFKKVMDDKEGVTFSPLQVATQVVNGINYSFFCNIKVGGSDSPNEAAMVRIYVHSSGEAQLVDIQPTPR